MTVEKFIRILGYIVYTALWSPAIILAMIVLPIVNMIMLKSIKAGVTVAKAALKSGIRHDRHFIETGVWI